MIKKYNMLLSLLLSLLLFIILSNTEIYSSWMGLYHDKQHSARTNIPGPDYPDSVIDWKFQTADQVISTPVIGPGEYFYDDNGNGSYDPPEAFVDLNGNGVYDEGEEYEDSNGNHEYDPGERYLDYNGNRKYDYGTLFAGSWDNTIYALNIRRDEDESFRVYWKYQLNDRITASPTLGPGEYFYDANHNGRFDPDERFIDENQNGIRDRNTIYVPSLDGNIYAFYSEKAEEGFFDFNGNGNTDDEVRLRWIFHVGSPILSSCVVDAGEPFEDANGNGIYDEGERFTDIYLNGVRDGSLEEPFEDTNANGRYDSYLNEPFTDLNGNGLRDGITIYFTAFDGRIYALNEDGSLKWATLLGSEGVQIGTTPAVSLNGERVFVTSPDGYIYALDASGRDGIQGAVIWKYKTDSYITASPAVSADNSVVFGTGYPDNKLYNFTFDGELKFEPVDVDGWVHSSPAIAADGTVYIAVADYKPYHDGPTSRLVAVSGNGELLWTDSYSSPGREYNSWLFSSPIIDKNGQIYFATSDNFVFAIYPTGDLKWWVELSDTNPQTTSAYWLRSTPVLGPDEALFVGSTDSYIYGLGKDVVRPGQVEPTIWYAGFSHGAISKDSRQFTLNAVLWDPEGNVAKVEVFDATLPGKPLIGNMTQIDYDITNNSLFYQLVWDIPEGYFRYSGQYLFEIKAYDAAGHESDRWPYLTVHQDFTTGEEGSIPQGLSLIAPDVLRDIRGRIAKDFQTGAELSPMQGENSPPEINLGGFYKTYLDKVNGGTLQIYALIKDNDGARDITRVVIYHIYFDIVQTIDITNLASQISETENEYLYEMQVGGGIPSGRNYHIFIIAMDSQGNVTTWPYLEVN